MLIYISQYSSFIVITINLLGKMQNSTNLSKLTRTTHVNVEFECSKRNWIIYLIEDPVKLAYDKVEVKQKYIS